MTSLHIDKLPVTEQHLVRNVTRHLIEEFAGTFGPETIERFVADSLDELVPNTKITSFPLLTERFARERLRALAKVDGLTSTGRAGVLFLRVHDAGRSLMAARWLPRHLAGDRVDVYSAG